FADYAQQNMNVFSIVDNLMYKEGGATKYLEKATADYHVIGWHSKADDDPFTTVPAPAPAPTPKDLTDKKPATPLHKDRLKDCKMQMKNKDKKAGMASSWLESDSL